MLDEALRRERVTREEIHAAVRANGYVAVEDVEAVVLETDGSFSVMGSVEARTDTALEDVDGYRQAARRHGGAEGDPYAPAG